MEWNKEQALARSIELWEKRHTEFDQLPDVKRGSCSFFGRRGRMMLDCRSIASASCPFRKNVLLGFLEGRVKDANHAGLSHGTRFKSQADYRL
jgi:hypothetical protein